MPGAGSELFSSEWEGWQGCLYLQECALVSRPSTQSCSPLSPPAHMATWRLLLSPVQTRGLLKHPTYEISLSYGKSFPSP
jgi:hypothetical protein